MKERTKNRLSRFQKYRGFSFVELVVAIFIFTLVMITMSSTALDSFVELAPQIKPYILTPMDYMM